jgi:hypothetical protein
MQDIVQGPSLNSVLQLFPILAGYACISVSILLAAFASHIWERVEAWRAYHHLYHTASEWRHFASNETIQESLRQKLINMTFPVELYTENHQANSFLNGLLLDLKKAQKERPESFS